MEQANPRPRRVLIVEDELFVAMDMADTIHDLGFEVVGPALTRDVALRLARSEEIDAALLDVNLGGGETSEDVAGCLRERHVPYAFLTAYDRSAVRFVRDADPVLSKPVTPALIARTLTDCAALH